MPGDPLIGRDLGKYHVEEVIGRGGMGTVYRARDSHLDRSVALKVLGSDRASDAGFRERFLRESRLLASLDHPNVVPVFEAGADGGELYIAMRFVPGPDLSRFVLERGALPPVLAASIVGQIGDALDAAHALGLVHRDVKPANVLIIPGPGPDSPVHAYLTDFGLTKSTGAVGLTEVGRFVGTPGYVAPEQIQGQGIDHRADIYSLGCVLYDCLTGAVPFPRDSTLASLFAHVNEPPPVPSRVRPALGDAFDPVISRALAKDPEARYQTAGALAHDARIAAAVPVSSAGKATVIVAADEVVPPPPAGRTVIDAAVVAAGATLVSGGANTVVAETGAANTVVSETGAAAPIGAADATQAVTRDLPAAAAPTVLVTPPPPPTVVAGGAVASGQGDDGRAGKGPGAPLAALLGGVLAIIIAATALGYASGGFGLLTDTRTTAPSATLAGNQGPGATPTSRATPGDSGGATGSTAPESADPGSSETPSTAPPSETPSKEPDRPDSSDKPEPDDPTPTPDTTPPKGGDIVLNGGNGVVTKRDVVVRVQPRPNDPSGVTRMAISNSSSRPNATRPFDRQVGWRIPGGQAGKRTVYVWFQDREGNWSGSKSDSITFDNPPVVDNGVVFRPNFCNGDHRLDLLATPRYVATDKDGTGKLRVVRVWTGGSSFPGTKNLSSGIESNGKYVVIEVTGAAGAGDFTFTDYFTVRDPQGVERSGHFRIEFEDC